MIEINISKKTIHIIKKFDKTSDIVNELSDISAYPYSFEHLLFLEKTLNHKRQSQKKQAQFRKQNLGLAKKGHKTRMILNSGR
jgi:hypothetical protein